MPGVADQIRKTNLKQEQKRRRQDMSELLSLIKENRLHEADERQLETLKLALELNQLLEERKGPREETTTSTEEIVEGLKEVMQDFLEKIPQQKVVVASPEGTVTDPARPSMKHTSLADIVQNTEKVDIAHSDDIGEVKEGKGDSASKLEKLRELKRKKDGKE